MSEAGKLFKVAFSAGEASGDQHAAHIFEILRSRCPNIEGIGMGGVKMREAGMNLDVDSSAMGVIGLIEILKHYPEIRRALNRMKALLRKQKPDLLVCVDYKEFNLKLARYAKKLGIKVLFYVSPQVWAWRSGRVETYGRAIDMMAVIFPFETPFYEAKNVPVRYVGHPSVDRVKHLYTQGENRHRFGLDAKLPVVGILPGSRGNEIRRMLPVMIEAATLLHQKKPSIQFVMPQADSISDELLSQFMPDCPFSLTIIKHQPYEVISACDAVMTTSGTATLEIALLGVPMVIAYRLSALTYWLGRILVKIPYIGLPNIIAGTGIVKEFIQQAASAKNLSQEIDELLFNSSYRDQCVEALQQVKEKLGHGGGTVNMANLILEMLQVIG